MNVKLDNIIEIVNEKQPASPNIIKNNSSTTSFKSKNINSEINVIGQNVEEACFVIDKYLDDCAIAKLSPVRIVHGKGTGVLRKAVGNYLKHHKAVDSYRLGTYGEGEDGVTIVHLK